MASKQFVPSWPGLLAEFPDGRVQAVMAWQMSDTGGPGYPMVFDSGQVLMAVTGEPFTLSYYPDPPAKLRGITGMAIRRPVVPVG